MVFLANGWVKLDRSIMEHWLWDDKPFSYGQAWMDLIMLANHADTKKVVNGAVTKFKAGTVNRSILSLSKRWGWDKKKAAKFLTILESDEMVTTKRTTHGTTITIVNYSKFQNQGSTKRTTDGSTDGQPLDTNKNVKNEKKVRSYSASAPTTHTAPTLEEISKYCEANGISTDTIRFYQYNNAKGWKMDWKEALTAWIQREKERDPGPVRRKGDWRNFEQRQAEEEDELERQLLSME